MLAFTVQGLVPFANHPEFVFYFSGMSCLQLQAIRRESQLLRDAVVCDYNVDIYLLKMSPEDFEVDHALLLFAAGCLLSSTTDSPPLRKWRISSCLVKMGEEQEEV